MKKNLRICSAVLVLFVSCSCSRVDEKEYSRAAVKINGPIKSESNYKKSSYEKEYDGIVIKVNEQIKTESDVEKECKLLSLSMGRDLPYKEMKEMAKSELVSLCVKGSTVQKFEPKGGWVSSEAIDDTFKSIAASNNMSVQGFINLLKSKGIEPGLLKEQIKINLSWMEYIKARYMRSINVSESELRALVKDMKEKRSLEAFYVSKMFFPVMDKKEEEYVASKVNNVIRLLKSGANFANVARQFSGSGVSSKDSDIGWIVDGQLSQEENTALKSMSIGEYRTVKNNRGYSILLLKDRRRGGQNSFTELRFVQAVIPFNEQPSQEAVTQLTDYAKEMRASSRNSSEFIKKAKDSGICAILDPTTVVLEAVQPEMRRLIENIPAGGIGNPIVTPQGIITICMLDRKNKTIREPTSDELKNRIIGDRLATLAAKELQDARERAEIIDYEQYSNIQTR